MSKHLVLKVLIIFPSSKYRVEKPEFLIFQSNQDIYYIPLINKEVQPIVFSNQALIWKPSESILSDKFDPALSIYMLFY